MSFINEIKHITFTMEIQQYVENGKD